MFRTVAVLFIGMFSLAMTSGCFSLTPTSFTVNSGERYVGTFTGSGPSGPIVFSLEQPPQHGVAKILVGEVRSSSDSVPFTYRSNQGYSGSDVFKVRTCAGSECASFTIDVTVLPPLGSGEMDTSFGDNGSIVFGPAAEDGRTVTHGFRMNFSQGKFRVPFLTRTGSHDDGPNYLTMESVGVLSFDLEGQNQESQILSEEEVPTTPNPYRTISAGAVDALSGRSVLATRFAGIDGTLNLISMNSSGQLDTSFVGGGYFDTTELVDYNTEEYGDLAFLSDGSLVVGINSRQNSTHYRSYTIRKYRPDGAFDTTFRNGTGKVQALGSGTYPNERTYTIDVLKVSRNEIHYATVTDAGDINERVSVRSLNADGTNGTLSYFFGWFYDPGRLQIYDIDEDASGNVFVLAKWYDSDSGIATKPRIYKIKPDNTLDTAFGDSGILTLQKPGTSDSVSVVPREMTIGEDGSLYVATFRNYYGSATFTVTKLNPANGAPVPEFADEGWFELETPDASMPSHAGSYSPRGNGVELISNESGLFVLMNDGCTSVSTCKSRIVVFKLGN